MPLPIRRRRHRVLVRACAFIDALEPRRLLASVGISGRVLTVAGNTTADVITVAPIAGEKVRVTINGSTSDHNLIDFNTIVVNADSGNDKVTISNTITKPASLRGGAGNDSLVGGGGNDSIDGGAGGDTIKGGSGSDTVDYSTRTGAVTVGLGTLSDDGEANEHDNIATDIETIIGGSGADNLKGHNNNNRIEGRGGNDTLIGLGGNDTLVGGAGADRLEGGDGADTGIDTVGDTLVSIETTSNGSPGSAVITVDRTLLITGTSGADNIQLNHANISGDDGVSIFFDGKITEFKLTSFDRVEINSLAGNDLVNLDAPQFDQPVLINLGDGNDRVEITEAGATVNGGNGNDSVVGEDGGGLFNGEAGVDFYEGIFFDHPFVIDLSLMPTTENARLVGTGVLIGNALNNRLEGGSNTLLRGLGGNDLLIGAADFFDTSTLDGGDGNDTLLGEGADPSSITFLGGPGNDSMVGGAGDDFFDGGAGGDTVKGGGGNDTMDYSARTAPVTVGLGTLSDDGEVNEHDNIAIDIETILGGNGADNLKGHANNNRIEGRGGNDTLIGLGGNDTLVGGPGTDRLEGGDGTDTGVGTSGDTLISIENTVISDDTFVVGPDGNVTVNGTARHDEISVHLDLTTDKIVVTVNSATRSFGPDVIVTAFGGDESDTFFAGTDAHVIFHGGAGHDWFRLNENASDTVFGDAGDDRFDFQEEHLVRSHHDGGAGTDTMVVGWLTHDTLDLGDATSIENALVFGSIRTITGTAANNRIEALDEDFARTIQGMGGNDTLIGGPADDSLDGGEGNDSLDGGSGDDTLSGGPGTDTLNGNSGTDTGVDTTGDTLISIEDTTGGGGGAFIDSNRTLIVTGTDQSETIVVNADDQSVEAYGTTFDKTLFDSVRILSRGGDDQIWLSGFATPPARPLFIEGGSGNDSIISVDSDIERFDGGEGNDFVQMHDTGILKQFIGGNGIDGISLLQSDAGVHLLDLRDHPGVENASLQSGTLIGNDLDNDLLLFTGTLQGGAGNDTLRITDDSFGGSLVQGGIGNDHLTSGGLGSDTLEGGDGDDLLESNSPGSTGDTFRGGAGNDSINGGSGGDHIEGNSGNDTLHGWDGNDRLFGGDGNDHLFGDAGDDLLFGQNNADTLDGGAGTNDRGFNDGQDTLTNIEVVLT